MCSDVAHPLAKLSYSWESADERAGHGETAWRSRDVLACGWRAEVSEARINALCSALAVGRGVDEEAMLIVGLQETRSSDRSM